jgi:hypothetical protein
MIILEMESQEVLPQAGFQVSASQVATITGMSHWHPDEAWQSYKENLQATEL